jgi:mono/diheme cytochrome c family protein
VILLALALALRSPSPGGEGGQADPDGLELFERRIRPALVEHCHSCHSADAKKLKGGLLLDSREGLLKGGDTGAAIVPGDPDRSLLMTALKGSDEKLQMPPKKRLPPELVADFEAWIRRGAPDPRAKGAVATGVDPARAKSHWAFLPPADPAPPAVRGPVRTPVDAFLLAKLEAKGLAFNPEADRRTLLRRLTFDLTGLPPTPEELDSSETTEQAVERLLASPRYGERWGRHWLDVARYADTKGYVYEDREEARFVFSATYRDWVVRAFNEDLPYDRFVLLQVAADRAATERRDLAAMGFLTVGRRFINNVHDIIDDRIDTVTRGLLGLTVSCARCHDHKFDPVPSADYYALYGVFHGSTERVEPVGAPAASGDAVRTYEADLAQKKATWEKKLADQTKALLDRLRAKTPDYLAAALDVGKFPTEEFYEILGPDDLKPFIVRRWAAYLDRSRTGPVWSAWHALRAVPERDLAARAAAVLAPLAVHPAIAAELAKAPPASMKDVAAAFGRAFKAAPDDPALREVLHGPDSPVATPVGAFSEIEWFYDESVRQDLGKTHREIERAILKSDAAPPWASYLADRDVLVVPRVFRRGNPANKGEEVPRRWLGFLGGQAFADGSGRLELARAIASPDNPLTARVWVNRVWMHHFGNGLVRTPSDFGLRSDPPTHPELLDWLARWFVREGWSTKKLHRLLLLSAAYRQASDDAPAARAVDPENRLLARFPRRRLDFESLRDALLAVSGRLDLTMGGRPVDVVADTSRRRTLYGFIDRLNLPNLHRSFDFTGADAHLPQRFTTIVPQQALFLLNSPFLARQARALLSRVPERPDRVVGLYRLVHGRAPSPRELALARDFLATGVLEKIEVKAGPWSYGYGEVGSDGRLAAFTPLPHFTGSAWQGGPARPDAKTGWVWLEAKGGHAGNDARHAAVRRWTAPKSGTLAISGTLAHRRPEGDGIRGRIVHSGRGTLATWALHNLEAETSLKGLPVKQGETIDFVVDLGEKGEITWDEFFWAPVLKMDGGGEWNAAADFAGPGSAALGAWEKLAQVLLLSNEFVFVD